MPAAVVKGIILSISIIAALGIAVLENPQVQEWLEEQRRKLVELLRSIGEELDPESRRAAEAFAFEGRTPVTDAGIRRGASGSSEAAAVATGRSMNAGASVRRIPVRGPSDPDEAEERRRKGREYLARRNQQMYELQERRKAAQALAGEGAATPPSPTSFDALVDNEGKLKAPTTTPAETLYVEPIAEQAPSEMREVERSLVQPMLAGPSAASASAFHMGSQLSNPFSDEYAMERSETPKPPIPPKIELDSEEAPDPPISLPGSYSPRPQPMQIEDDREELSYEEQLAIALSLSEAESSVSAATVRQSQSDEHNEDDDLRAAIAASLKDMDDQQAAHAVAHAGPHTPQPKRENAQPLVDLTPSDPSPPQMRRQGRSDWEALFDHQFSPSQEPLTLVSPRPASTAPSDELYRVTPELTRARLATLEEQRSSSTSFTASPMPYDPVREAATIQPGPSQQQLMDASFYSAPSSVAPPSTQTFAAEATPQLVDVSENAPAQPQQAASTPPSVAAPSSFGFETDSDSDTFASMPGTPPRTQSDVEVIDVVDDSDVDMLSEEGDGIATPDSWTEVGSRDGESEEAEEEERRPVESL